MSRSIAENWKILSGERNWEGLLDPLDINLRQYIIHYGERAEAIADAFNHQIVSKGYKLSCYSMQDFFSEVGLEFGNPYKYSVTNFIYARSEIKLFNWVLEGESSWIAYVAVATDEGKAILGRRDILISWRGIITDLHIEDAFEAIPVSAEDILGESDDNPHVLKRFLSIYTAKDPDSIYTKASAREQIIREVRKLVQKYKDEEVSITITGHSIGAAIATLNAMDIVANGHNKPATHSDKPFPVTAILFASPRVGDHGFKEVFERLKNNNNLRLLRINNARDLVPLFPPFGFAHVGEQLVIDTTKSPYLKHAIRTVHNLEVNLHGIAGTQGEENEFELVIDRDISLVNKALDGLKDEFSVPIKWWIEQNKGMVQEDDGSWRLDTFIPDPPKL